MVTFFFSAVHPSFRRRFWGALAFLSLIAVIFHMLVNFPPNSSISIFKRLFVEIDFFPSTLLFVYMILTTGLVTRLILLSQKNMEFVAPKEMKVKANTLRGFSWLGMHASCLLPFGNLSADHQNFHWLPGLLSFELKFLFVAVTGALSSRTCGSFGGGSARAIRHGPDARSDLPLHIALCCDVRSG